MPSAPVWAPSWMPPKLVMRNLKNVLKFEAFSVAWLNALPDWLVTGEALDNPERIGSYPLTPTWQKPAPLIDTGLSIVRRLRSGNHIMQADRQHLHHRLLMEHEGSQRPAVLSIYFLTSCFCIIAVSFTRLNGFASIVFLVVIALLTIRILRNLGAFEPRDAGEEEAAPIRGVVRIRFGPGGWF